LGGTAYGNGPTRAELPEREIAVLAPVPAVPVKKGRLGKRDFQIDLAAGTLPVPPAKWLRSARALGGPPRQLRRFAVRHAALG
jgi:hypothetical protein